MLLGADCAPRDAPAEINVAGTGHRSRHGLIVRRMRLEPFEVQRIGGAAVTTPLRTAYDLSRRGGLVERVVAIDALANLGRFPPDVLLHYCARGSGSRGNADVALALAHADRRAGSPMESRIRMIIELSGLPRPEVQWVVQFPDTRTAMWLDLAYPHLKIGIEYEGVGHADPRQVLRDAGRYTRLVDRGWRIYRYTKHEVYGEPERIVAEIGRALARTR